MLDLATGAGSDRVVQLGGETMTGPKVTFSGGPMDGVEWRFPVKPPGQIWDRFIIEVDSYPDEGVEGMRLVYELTHFAMDGTTARYELEQP